MEVYDSFSLKKSTFLIASTAMSNNCVLRRISVLVKQYARTLL